MRRACLLLAVAACGGSDAAPDAAPDDASAELAPLLIGAMVHIETQAAWQSPDSPPGFFDAYVGRIRDDYVPLLASHGARFTWEPRDEISQLLASRGDPLIDDLLAADQGVGAHADKGYPTSTQAAFTADVTEVHDGLAALYPGLRHVSGVCSELDWVTAAADAGFAFVTGVVAYCLMSLPEADRPPEYADCAAPNLCHDVYPATIEERIQPRRVADGATWLDADPDGPIVIIPSSGGLTCAAEVAAGLGPGNCRHTAEDSPLVLADLEAAIAARQPGRVSTYYLGWSYGAVLDLEVAEAWLTAIDAHVAAGTVRWATLGEMYDAYVASE